MKGEIAIGGVLVPALLLAGVAALLLTALLTRLLNLAGFYRLVAWRPMVDLALFLLVLGLVTFLSAFFGPNP